MQSVQLISDIPAAIIQLQFRAYAAKLTHRTDHRQVREPKSFNLWLRLCDLRIFLGELVCGHDPEISPPMVPPIPRFPGAVRNTIMCAQWRETTQRDLIGTDMSASRQ